MQLIGGFLRTAFGVGEKDGAFGHPMIQFSKQGKDLHQQDPDQGCMLYYSTAK